MSLNNNSHNVPAAAVGGLFHLNLLLGVTQKVGFKIFNA
jgi:hypothetical protein